MAVGFGSYEIARSGLYASERGLFVTGHNISNANTPGYVRQQAMITTAPYFTLQNKYGMQQVGLGADIEQIRQIRHAFLDSIYRQENTLLGYWETRNKTFQDVQAILGEPLGTGLQSIMNQFWDAWQELSKEPDSLTVRALVLQRGEALVNHINHLGAQLDKLQDDLNSEIRVRIDEINQLTSQIAELNLLIMKNEATGDSANDYRDQRNLLIDRLTKLIDVDIIENQYGSMTITVGGHFLVINDKSTNLYAGHTEKSGIFYVPMLEGTEIEVPIKNGILKGLLESRGLAVETGNTNNIVSVLKNQLNTLVQTLVNEVNSLHRSGKTLDNPPQDGEDFFTLISPIHPYEMGNIRLNPIFSEPNGLNYIVASKDGAPGISDLA
ncbi:MAG TPA: flagellar hook-associated protein FlgK [Clostridiaceae bacterium]|nr:flagellar hook-associated protein FlgK [Clostridiaceae bacterium]